MRKLCLFLILFSFVSISCSRAEVISFDRNQDGNPDLWNYSKGYIYKTAVDDNGDMKPDVWFFWDKKGRLVKEQGKSRKGNYTHNYQSHKIVEINGDIFWINELNIKRSYPKKVWPFVSKTYLYTKDNQLRFSEVDNNQDGLVDKTLVINNFRKIDEYLGPIKK